MNKLGFLLLALLAPKGVEAAEVGAQFPQLANTTAVLAVAIADTGTSTTSWAFDSTSEQRSVAQHATLDKYAETTLEKLSHTTRERIFNRLETQYEIRPK